MYEKLLREAKQHGVDIYEKPMKPRIKGLYADKTIWINKFISTSSEKACILAEELGHHYTSTGNILDQKNIENRKQELRARRWAYKKLVPITKIIQAHKEGIKNQYEFAEFLNVTESFLSEALNWYKEKHGLYLIEENLIICFDPLRVIEMF